MPRTPCRKFNLGDGMILIGAAAVGFAIVRAFDLVNLNPLGIPPWREVVMRYGVPLALAGSIGLLAVRARRPRAGSRRIFRQPGMAASTVAVLMTATWCLPFAIFPGFVYRTPPYPSILLFAPLAAGPGVLGVWVIMGLSRAARPERGWIDRCGIGLGLCWVAIFLIELITIR